ncbi:MAG: adenosylcobinamide-GDP ribazoletransferase [Stellaceae bacterium]
MSAPDGPLPRPPGLFGGFAAATAFLTRIPIDLPPGAARHIGNAAWAFPLVGAGIGAVAALTYGFAQLLGLHSWLAALTAVTTAVVLTGALHEDGLADTADGFCGGPDREAKLAIMRDSRHGTFGVLALVLSVSLRAAALAAMGDMLHAGLALVAAHSASRAILPMAMRLLSPARVDGLGFSAGKPSAASAVVAVFIGAIVALAGLGPMLGTIAICLAGATVFAMAGLASRQIGGYTGDVLGCFQQIGEIVMLLAASAA